MSKTGAGLKVVVGMSGGVDSTVAAYLLKEQGYDVTGVTMRMWHEEGREPAADGSPGQAAWEQTIKDAGEAADFLGIPHCIMDFKQEFYDNVVCYFMSEYLKGRTPNPCIACNRFVKWEALLKRCGEFGAEYVATGHYARTQQLLNGRYALRTAADASKDQTYALYGLSQRQLAHTIFPVGGYTKREVREIAAKIGLKAADKPDSQEICFIPDGDYAGFIERNCKDSVPPQGDFISQDGTVLGRHKGIIHYTIGQRKGLNLPLGYPVFVSDICPETNEVVVGDEQAVYTDRLMAGHLNLMTLGEITADVRAKVKIRYSHGGAMCTVRRVDEKTVECVFDEPVRAATPGQAAVFYDGEYVVGGGTIL